MYSRSVTLPRRAPALPPDERRKAIISATLPLLAQHGQATTTRQIADAAGIAEGTIFRVFPDKESLIREAIASVFDPEEVIAQLDLIDRSAPLERKLLAITINLADRLDRIFHVLMVMRTFPPEDTKHPKSDHDDPIVAKVIELLTPHATELRKDVPTAVKHLRLVIFAGTHPRITHDEPLAPSEIVDMFLHGCYSPPPLVPPPHALDELSPPGLAPPEHRSSDQESSDPQPLRARSC
jgi:AcrR family transcriptional regulator